MVAPPAAVGYRRRAAAVRGGLAKRVEEYREAGVDRPLLLPRLPDFEAVAGSLAPYLGGAARPRAGGWH